MTPLDVSDGIAAYLMDELRKLNETSEMCIRDSSTTTVTTPRKKPMRKRVRRASKAADI